MNVEHIRRLIDSVLSARSIEEQRAKVLELQKAFVAAHPGKPSSRVELSQLFERRAHNAHGASLRAITDRARDSALAEQRTWILASEDVLALYIPLEWEYYAAYVNAQEQAAEEIWLAMRYGMALRYGTSV